MTATQRSWLIGLGTAILLAVAQVVIAYITANPPDAAATGIAGGLGFAAGRLATLRLI